MSIPGYSVKNRVTMTMFYLGVIAFGIFSFMRLQLDLYPDMDIPYILVMTTYIGASPADIETLVSRPIEENAVSVTGVKNVTSTSKENVGIVVLEFDWGYDMDQAEIDTRNNLDLVRDKLPDDADEPIVIAMDPSMSPIVMINLQGDMSSSEIRQVAEDRIQPMLERIDGIASVEVGGGEAVVRRGGSGRHRRWRRVAQEAAGAAGVEAAGAEAAGAGVSCLAPQAARLRAITPVRTRASNFFFIFTISFVLIRQTQGAHPAAFLSAADTTLRICPCAFTLYNFKALKSMVRIDKRSEKL